MPAVPPIGSSVEVQNDWLEQTSCDLYTLLGKNCAELSKKLDERSQQIDENSKQWEPNFPDEAAEELFKQVLEWLRQGLQRFYATFPAGVPERLNAVIDRLEDKID